MCPRLFTLGNFTLHTYGILVVAGFLAGLWLAGRLSRQQGLDPARILDLGIYSALGAILGSKVFMVIEDWSYYNAHPGEIFSFSSLRAAGVFYGGFLTALAVAAWYLRRHRLPFFRVADAFAPGIALGHAIGRLGCFAAGCCWGHPTALPWAVTFRDPYAAQTVGVPLDVPLHPAQLYEFLALLAICAVLLMVWRRRKFQGQVFSLYLMLYGVARFLLEYTRDRPQGQLPFGLVSASQGLAALLAVVGLVLWLRRAHA